MCFYFCPPLGKRKKHEHANITFAIFPIFYTLQYKNRMLNKTTTNNLQEYVKLKFSFFWTFYLLYLGEIHTFVISSQEEDKKSINPNLSTTDLLPCRLLDLPTGY